jgi:hypothetical protein
MMLDGRRHALSATCAPSLRNETGENGLGCYLHGGDFELNAFRECFIIYKTSYDRNKWERKSGL